MLGNERVLKQLIRRLSLPEMICNSHGEMLRTKLFVTNGKGREKSLRLYKGALPLLHWLHPRAYEYYMESFWNHHFPGDATHRDRNHRVAEAVALCANAGVEVLPYDLPKLQQEEIRKVTPDFPTLYLARDIKKAFPGEEKKTLFTRAVGALFYPGGCYAVYNTRDAAMKWKGMGEFKALHSLTEMARLNGGVTHLDGALLFGKSYHVHFLPLDDFGARLLGILTLPDWQEKLLDLLFESSTRTYGRGTMEYDAQVGVVKVLSHLDGDLARLLRFREGLWSHSGKFEVVCLPQQAEFVREFLGDRVVVREIRIETVEETLQESM